MLGNLSEKKKNYKEINRIERFKATTPEIPHYTLAWLFQEAQHLFLYTHTLTKHEIRVFLYTGNDEGV